MAGLSIVSSNQDSAAAMEIENQQRLNVEVENLESAALSGTASLSAVFRAVSTANNESARNRVE